MMRNFENIEILTHCEVFDPILALKGFWVEVGVSGNNPPYTTFSFPRDDFNLATHFYNIIAEFLECLQQHS